MRRSNSNSLPYFLIRAEANTETSSRQWNKALISILGMLVLGILLVAFVPQQGRGSNSRIKGPTYSNSSLGIEVKNLNSGVGHELQVVENNSEVVITSVDSASKGAKAGLESGDIILKVNQKSISGVDDFERSLDENQNHSVRLVIERKNGTKSMIELGAK